MQESELSILWFFNHTISSPFMDGVMETITTVKYWLPIYLIGAIYLIWKYKWRGVRLVVAALIVVLVGDQLTEHVIKPLVNRARPCALLPNGTRIVSWINLPM